MARRIEGTITALELGKQRQGASDVSINRVVVHTVRGRDVKLSSTSMPRGAYEVVSRGGLATLYVGGPFFFFLPSQIFGARSATGAFFHAPRAIFWIPGGLLVSLIAFPLAILPITLLLFPILVLAGIWMMLISWSGMGARGMFKRDERRAAKARAAA
ncbi:MAG: hypothetical protein JSS00_09805 [Proteobacteria bacterium]|nr:hypothetical protein [Pseudomonadota bacterium]